MNFVRHTHVLCACLALAAGLGGCTVGPDYARPDIVVPGAWKELPPAKTAQPSDDRPRGAWWDAFSDPTLDALERDAASANQTLSAAEANYRQARAAVRAARAGEFPTITGNLGATRARAGGAGRGNSSGATGSGGTGSGGSGGSVANSLSLALDAAWEVDLWGRVRRLVEASEDTAQASAADLENTRLSIQAELAQDYLQLRVTDATRRVLQETVAAYERSLTLTQNRYNAGVAARAEVVQAETQLLGARASLIDVDGTRTQLEHAIAILTGRPPANVTVTVMDTTPMLPTIPAGLPSELLERRPDVAGAERRVAAANAQIGVATAAMFPTLSLSATGGFAGSSFANWFTAPARFWSIGLAAAQPLFDAGLRRAQRDEAIAAYDATVANYRQTLLTAFRDVEDNLALLRVLAEEARVQDGTLRSARESLQLTLNQYKAGLISYINVVAVQTIEFNTERSVLDLRNRRYVATIALVKALGGGFDAATLAATSEQR